jgi:hypothetical protein
MAICINTVLAARNPALQELKYAFDCLEAVGVAFMTSYGDDDHDLGKEVFGPL